MSKVGVLFLNPWLESFVCVLLRESFWIWCGLFGLSACLEVEEGGHDALFVS